jgi:osmotically-inducible protein OsmY
MDATMKVDAEMARAAQSALDGRMLMPPDQPIRLEVSEGTVTLTGTVPYWSQRYDAERAIETLAGVRRVVNRIEVRPSS